MLQAGVTVCLFLTAGSVETYSITTQEHVLHPPHARSSGIDEQRQPPGGIHCEYHRSSCISSSPTDNKLHPSAYLSQKWAFSERTSDLLTFKP